MKWAHFLINNLAERDERLFYAKVMVSFSISYYNTIMKLVTDTFFLYRDASGRVQINALLRDETLWLTQKAMAELFEVEIPAISKHIKNILTDGELKENQVISKMETTAADGNSYNTAFYNLDMIIAVGYRVN